MKINFDDYDLSSFLVKTGEFCGISATLIQPDHIGTKFTQKNSIFRSSIWSTDTGELCSGSWKKFVNWGENPDNFIIPNNIKGWKFLEKIDGSACIVDYVNSTFSARTRGTFTYKSLENNADFDYLFDKYPKIQEFVQNHPNYTLLLEIVTPNLKVVIDYGEIDFYLCGCVNKENYSLLTQKQLDDIANDLGVKRPKYYQFDSIDQLLYVVDAWKGLEGVVAYSPDGQHLLKVKSDWYRKIHAAKENFRNIESLIDVWLIMDCPNYTDFVAKIQEVYDYEVFTICQFHISSISDAYKEVQKIMDGIDNFVNVKVRPLSTRKDQAMLIESSYGKSTGRTSMCYSRLDNKPWNKEQIKKLLFQCLKSR